MDKKPSADEQVDVPDEPPPNLVDDDPKQQKDEPAGKEQKGPYKHVENESRHERTSRFSDAASSVNQRRTFDVVIIAFLVVALSNYNCIVVR